MRLSVLVLIALTCVACSTVEEAPLPSTVKTPAPTTVIEALHSLALLDALVAAANSDQYGDCIIFERQKHPDIEGDIPALLDRLDSERPCVSVARPTSPNSPGKTTEGRMAAYLILSHHRRRFPPTIDSDHFRFDPEYLRAWWSAREKYGWGCPELEVETITLSAEKRRQEELDIWESVLRHQFDFYSSYQGYRAPVFYLETRDGEDLPPELMARFRGHTPPVEPASAFEKTDQQVVEMGNSVQGIPMGNRINGLFFDVGEVEWQNNTYVTVYGSYYEGSLSASGWTYCLVKEQGQWVIVGWKDGWVS